MSNSVSLHRILKASPEKVFRAFTQASAIASWLPPYGFLCTVHELKAEKGGTFRMSFENFSTGNSHSFGGTYLEVKPGEFLKYTDKFDDPNLPGENDHHCIAPPNCCRHGNKDHTRRHSRGYPRRDVLPGLAGVTGKAGQARRTGDPRRLITKRLSRILTTLYKPKARRFSSGFIFIELSGFGLVLLYRHPLCLHCGC